MKTTASKTTPSKSESQVLEAMLRLEEVTNSTHHTVPQIAVAMGEVVTDGAITSYLMRMRQKGLVERYESVDMPLVGRRRRIVGWCRRLDC